MTTDQQDQIILGYLRSHFAGTSSLILASTIAARTALQLEAVEHSLERLHRAGAIEADIRKGSDTPTPVTAVR